MGVPPSPLRARGRAIHSNLFLRRPTKKGFPLLSLTFALYLLLLLFMYISVPEIIRLLKYKKLISLAINHPLYYLQLPCFNDSRLLVTGAAYF